MTTHRTGAERYFADQLKDPDYREAYVQARHRIDQVDAVVRAFDDRRLELDLTKADLARRAGMKPEAIRRLFSVEHPNPTLSTISALALALDLEITVAARPDGFNRAPSAGSGTRRRSA